MSSLLHRYQQPILIGITLIIIATFVLYWNGPMGGRMGTGGGGAVKFGSIYGRTLTNTDVERDIHKWQVAYALGLSDLVGALGGSSETQEAQIDFVVNMHVLDHEAEALQIKPTDQEVQDEEMKVPAFQTDGQFDPSKLERVVQGSMLPSLGFTDQVIDDLVREQVKLKKVAVLIGATINLSPTELDNRFAEGNEEMNVAVIHLSTSDVEDGIQVSDADAQKAYNGRKDQYRSPEERKVAVAAFELTAAQKNLTGKDRVDALQKLGNQAWEFAQSVADKSANFPAQAAKFGAKLMETGNFTTSAPDPLLESIPSAAENAFKLSADYPITDPLQGENGYYVLHLDGVTPSAPLTYDQAKPQVIADIKKQRAAQIMQTRAIALKTVLQMALKGGKSVEDAAKEAGVTAEDVPPFSLMTANKLDVPGAQDIIENSVSLSPGQFSEFMETGDGGMYLYMKSRKQPDSTIAAAGKEMMRPQFLRGKQEEAFLEWLRLARQSARFEVTRSS
jgi:peptidyl-prolyl cis-trans isomerase D